MTTTPVLGITELASGQALPETTVNEAARYLEQGARHFVIVDRDLSAPAGGEADGSAYIVSGTGTGAWAGHDGDIAFKMSTGWLFINVTEGMSFWIADENKYLVATSSSTFSELATAAAGGTYQIWVPANAMTARTTNGAAAGSSETTTNKIMVATLDFDQSTDEFAQFRYRMPKSWNESTVTMTFQWTATTTGDVVWGAQAVAISNDDAMDSAFGTAQTVTDGVTAANDYMESAATSAITIGGTPAEGDLVVFQVYRDADNGSDTLAADAKLLGVVLTITTNAADDS
jgi:hypothetical protein